MGFPWLQWAVFLVVQVFVIVAFKYGGTYPSRFVPSFVVANIVGVPSTILLMHLYKRIPANACLALTTGTIFMLSQVVLWLVFREPLSGFQRFGIGLVCIGVACLCWKGV